MQSAFAGKNILIGVTGSIAAFKVAGWVTELAKEEAQVHVVMTSSAQHFISPVTFAALSGNKVQTDMFENGADDIMAHINLGRDAEVILIAPATANCLAKLAAGMADDLLSTTVLASRCKVLVCPAMNGRMFSHQATQKNIKQLRALGYTVVDPDAGMMACKEEGEGRLPEWSRVREHLARALIKQDFHGKNILITAGPTREPIDPARFISNRSSGKMGYALAQAAFRRGGKVLLISGPTTLECPAGVERIAVTTAQQMYEAVLANSRHMDVIMKAAAVADYKPKNYFEHKVKKDGIEPLIELVRNPDILMELGRNKKKGQILVGFAAESQNLREEGGKKLRSKNLDLIAINDISGKNTGFESDTNQIILLSSDDKEDLLPHTTKLHAANLILDRLISAFDKVTR